VLDRTHDDGIERALRVAERAHRGQSRKCSEDVPYVLHPIHCAISLARLGCEPHVIQAAILHDVVEDCDGWTIERVRREFGERVASIVAELTEDKSLTWAQRKQWQIDHVSSMSSDALTVKAADKIHNLRTLCADLRDAADRSTVWARFRGGRERTTAMSRALVDALAPRVSRELADGLRAAIEALEAIEGRGP